MTSMKPEPATHQHQEESTPRLQSNTGLEIHYLSINCSLDNTSQSLFEC